MSPAHPLEVGPVLGGRGLNEIPPAVTLEIEWYRLAPCIEPHERLVVAGNDSRRRQIRDNRQQLGKVRGDGARLGVPPAARKSTDLVGRVATNHNRREQSDRDPYWRPATPDLERTRRPPHCMPGQHRPQKAVRRI